MADTKYPQRRLSKDQGLVSDEGLFLQRSRNYGQNANNI
jgi:hypothetical protein